MTNPIEQLAVFFGSRFVADDSVRQREELCTTDFAPVMRLGLQYPANFVGALFHRKLV